jgi:hypothetical protein
VPKWDLAQSDSQQDEIAYIAKQVFETLQQESGGSGGGSAGTAQSLASSFGKSGAVTLEEFEAAALAQFNFEFAKVGGDQVASFDKLDASLQKIVRDNWANADKSRKELAEKQADRDKETAETRKKLKEAEEKKADEAEQKLGQGAGVQWTPKDGFGPLKQETEKAETEDEGAGTTTALTGGPGTTSTGTAVVGLPPMPKRPKSAEEVERELRRKRLGKLTAVQAAELEPMPDVNGASTEEEYVTYVLGVINSQRAMQGMKTIRLQELPPGQVEEFKRDFVTQRQKLRQQKLDAAARKDRVDAETRRIQNEARLSRGLPTLEQDEEAEDREAVEKARQAEDDYQKQLAVWEATQAQQAGKGALAPGQTTGALTAPSAHDFFAAEHLEELTRRIYPRIRTRLHKELLVDRERAGSLTNFR